MHWTGRHVLSLALLAMTPLVAAAQLTVSGRVTNDAGVGLPGAQVVIEGTTVGTATDPEGAYRLLIPTPRGAMVLLVRTIGYRPARDTLTETSGTSTRDFRLAPDPLNLSQVVVTASRAEAERATLGMTISTVNGDELSRSASAQLDAA